MNIREGTPRETDRALEIWHAAITATHSFLASDDKGRFAGIVEAMLASVPFTVIEKEDEEVQGFMVYLDGSIEALFVDPVAHGRGYGSALIAYALSLDPQSRVDANEQADNAVTFYEARGFVRVGRSERDAEDLPYPVVHLRHPGPEAAIT
jgi:putative acetyltransferase